MYVAFLYLGNAKLHINMVILTINNPKYYYPMNSNYIPCKHYGGKFPSVGNEMRYAKNITKCTPLIIFIYINYFLQNG